MKILLHTNYKTQYTYKSILRPMSCIKYDYCCKHCIIPWYINILSHGFYVMCCVFLILCQLSIIFYFITGKVFYIVLYLRGLSSSHYVPDYWKGTYPLIEHIVQKYVPVLPEGSALSTLYKLK